MEIRTKGKRMSGSELDRGDRVIDNYGMKRESSHIREYDPQHHSPIPMSSSPTSAKDASAGLMLIPLETANQPNRPLFQSTHRLPFPLLR